MKVDRVRLHRVRLPLVTPFRSSLGAEVARDALLVEVIGPDGAGWGECVAMTEPLYSPEHVDGAQAIIRDHLIPRLAAAGKPSAPAVAPALRAVKGHPMAKAALELALLDADLRVGGRSLATHLGAARDRVPAGVAVGLIRPLGALLDAVDGYVAQGYQRIKLKIEPGWDVEPVRAVRQRVGDAVALQVDANGAYTLADGERLAALDPFHLLLIEQPLAEDDLAGHAALARRLATPICLDEAITSARVAAEAIARGACSVVNVKAGRVGGYLEAVRVHDVCSAAGIPVWCGGMLETGVGRAANLALAALPGFTLPGDLSASDRYFDRDVTAPFVLTEGCLAVPAGPGLGVTPDPDALADLSAGVEEVRWTSR